MSSDYTAITELPGGLADREQVERIYQRYSFAAHHARGVDVLDVGCGGGLGLGYLSRRARRVVGGDRTLANVYGVKRYYGSRLAVAGFDATALPFAAASFDIILLFEVLYYLKDPERFLDECKRLLRRPGNLLISTVNKEWKDFNPSAFSVRYYSAPELRTMLEQRGFGVRLAAGFPVPHGSMEGRAVSAARRIAVRFHLIPKSFKYKALLKRVVYGSLHRLPSELDSQFEDFATTVDWNHRKAGETYKILYAAAIID